MNRKMAHHINQNVIEFWEHDPIYGWRIVPERTANDWPPFTFQYKALRYHGTVKDQTRHGLIIWRD